MKEKLGRQWLQFSLRRLLVAIMLLGIGLAWFGPQIDAFLQSLVQDEQPLEPTADLDIPFDQSTFNGEFPVSGFMDPSHPDAFREWPIIDRRKTR